MDKNEAQELPFWKNKKFRIEISKDGKQLNYTANIIELTDTAITFQDKFGEIFSFNRSLVKEMQLLKEVH